MSTNDPREPRALADLCRRSADRLVLLRLRVARAIGGGGFDTASTDAWVHRIHPAVAAESSQPHHYALAPRDAADRAERDRGVRLGGYRGAGYLGSGSPPDAHVREVATFLGARSGADLGSPPIMTDGVREDWWPVLPGRDASQAIGAPTPEPPEDD